MNNINKTVLGGVVLLTVAAGNALAALPTEYAAIGTDADSTFSWAKTFAIGVVTFVMVVSLVKLARKR